MSFYTDKIKLKYDDIGKYNRLNIKSLIKYFEDIAGAHSSVCGYGLNDIPNTQITWLLLDWKVKMFSHPKYNEELTIKTWPRIMQKFYSYRDFEVFDSKNNLVAIASSKWIMICARTKKIEKITDTVLNAYGLEQKNVFEKPLDERPKIPDNLLLAFTYTIQRRDIDTNGHVNNLHYIDFALETLPEDVYNANEFDNIEIHYKKEIKYKETIKCYYSFEDNKNIVTIKSEDDSILHAIIKLY